MSKLLALAASYRQPSLNKQLLDIAVAEAKKNGATVTVLDYAALEAPIYRGEVVTDTLPAPVEAFSKALDSHDGILLATPEYNWSIPGGLKNILDWISVDPRAPLNGKTALLMCASPSIRGGMSGLQALRTPLECMGCWIYPQMVSIGRAQEQLKGDTLARESDQQHLIFCVTDFLRATNALVNHA